MKMLVVETSGFWILIKLLWLLSQSNSWEIHVVYNLFATNREMHFFAQLMNHLVHSIMYKVMCTYIHVWLHKQVHVYTGIL